ncbi:hypothetical protein ETB97_012596 [Aspergillus alliaceus]|uniref:HAD-like domain-containing protein n=1 Tax=Petromyces alliaceus TaxID=209559 RepID=A0A8H6E8D4_PETAA|nr:hypothetical protein ETB97_012596 [Aspergillus burnettii]
MSPWNPTLENEGNSNLDFIRSSLSSKTWFGFDLDDTLHEFRRASAHASSATAGAFADGRTSIENPRERFSLLLHGRGLETSTERLDRLLETYERNLKGTLTLKPGSLRLLQRIKSLGKIVIVVTEGPQDTQQWTVEELGLLPYIDVLVTTNEIGISKVDRLFPIVLRKYSIPASKIVYVGDNEKRDVVPARGAGILAVLYDEKGGCGFDDTAAFRVDSLEKLEYLLG